MQRELEEKKKVEKHNQKNIHETVDFKTPEQVKL